MPELPWEKWYPTNWASEPGLRLCEAATRGIWFEAVNTMMLQQNHSVSGTIEQLAALCICRVPQMQLAIEQLKQFNVAEVVEQNGNIILSNRRRKRACKISDLRSYAGKKSAESRSKASTRESEVASTPSASASDSVYASGKGGMGENFTEAPSWKEFWEFCQSPHCGIAAEWFAKDKFLAVDDWSKKRDWRKYALRVRGWWDNDGRPTKPPARNGKTQESSNGNL